jgi:hypothetical protein
LLRSLKALVLASLFAGLHSVKAALGAAAGLGLGFGQHRTAVERTKADRCPNRLKRGHGHYQQAKQDLSAQFSVETLSFSPHENQTK